MLTAKADALELQELKTSMDDDMTYSDPEDTFSEYTTQRTMRHSEPTIRTNMGQSGQRGTVMLS